LFTISILFFIYSLELPFLERYLNDPFTETVATVSSKVINLVHPDSHTETINCMVKSKSFTFTIKKGCNGFEAFLILLAGILSFPANKKMKLYGIILGMTLVYTVNILRVVSLYFVGVYFYSWFNVAHFYVGQSMVILTAILFWIYWIDKFAERP